MPPPGKQRGRRDGFTLLELIAAMSIVAVLSAIGIPKYQESVERARVAHAIGDIRTMQAELQGFEDPPPSLASIGRSDMLDPWGRPYIYYPFPESHGHAPPAGARRDRFLVPVNSEYDLYSQGKDGETSIAFTANASRDDVVRANDGSYIGLASKF